MSLLNGIPIYGLLTCHIFAKQNLKFHFSLLLNLMIATTYIKVFQACCVCIANILRRREWNEAALPDSYCILQKSEKGSIWILFQICNNRRCNFGGQRSNLKQIWVRVHLLCGHSFRDHWVGGIPFVTDLFLGTHYMSLISFFSIWWKILFPVFCIIKE